MRTSVPGIYSANRKGYTKRAIDDLRAFPVLARREAGYQINAVQHGNEPDDWKPMPTIGPGVREIRIRDAAGAVAPFVWTANPLG